MAKIADTVFKGKAPRIGPSKLPAGFAQVATNSRLLSGDLEAWNMPALVQALVTKFTGAVNSIYLLSGFWLNWVASEIGSYAQNVDVAQSTLATDRFYFTGTDAPRVSTVSLATDVANQGTNPAGAYPYKSYKLGIPVPTGAPSASSVVNVNNPVIFSDGTTLSMWTTSGTIAANQPVLDGSAIVMNGGSEMHADLLTGNVNLDIIQFNCQMDADNASLVFRFACDVSGNGPFIQISTSYRQTDPGGGGTFPVKGSVSFGQMANWAGGSKVVSSTQHAAGGLDKNLPLTLQMQTVKNPDGSFTYNVTLNQIAGNVLFTGSFSMPPPGTYGGFKNINSTAHCYVDEVTTGGQTAVLANEPIETTAYLYTWINALGEESAPSPASPTVNLAASLITTIAGIADPSNADRDAYGIVSKRLYRAVTTASGTVFQLVNTQATIPLGTTTYGPDTTPDTSLGESLSTTDFLPPPPDLQGLLALPNGIMAGFSGNQVCLSAQDLPYGWPEANRYQLDFPIVGIGAIDTAVVALTKSKPYVLYGTTPDGYTSSKIEFPQGCVSKRSIAYLRGVGVVYATATGLHAISGIAPPINLTENFFTLREWQALVPSSIIAFAHEDNYYAFYDTGTVKGGFMFERKDAGHGFSDLSYHMIAPYVDESADAAYMVLDQISQPTAASSNTLPTPDSKTVYQWDAGQKINYQWRSKKNELEYPTTFKACQIRAADYTNLVLRLIADGVQYFQKTITSGNEFVLPDVKPAKNFEYELAGTSRVTRVEIAESMEELT